MQLLATCTSLGSVGWPPAVGLLEKLAHPVNPGPPLSSLLPAAGLERVKLCKARAQYGTGPER